MLTARWDPFSDLWGRMEQLHNEMNRLFNRMSDGLTRSWVGAFPAVNAWEDDEAVYLEAELPGLDLSKLEIFVTGGNQLTLQGERQPNVPADGVWHRQERGFGKFARVLTLPVPVDADKVDARFEHGVLRIKLPKSETAKPRRIAVKAD
ncbi:MAG: Hsp20/alpha crystallin family protein [Gemmataceae bacterium]|nr:Hsp20/alpha crystallin family protein [Gemmataceae bacterium]MDW8266915.1 Hsp20/alpha crystallin family protein [Gemmataceae bacterium]